LFLASELRFHLPSLAVHTGWLSSTPPKSAHRYHFHISNPAQGNFTGLASHELDVAFLLQNFNGVFDGKGKKLAQDMADHFIAYVGGEGWCRDGEVVVFSDEGVKVVGSAEYDRVWRDGRGAVLERIGAERLWHLAEAWQGVRAEKEDADGRARL
jgi:hypothetical protein